MKREGSLENTKTNKSKRKIKIDFVRVLLIITMVYFIATFIKQQATINEYNLKIKTVNQDIQESNTKLDELKELKTKAGDTDYIEQIAREECGLVKPYEKVFIDLNK